MCAPDPDHVRYDLANARQPAGRPGHGVGACTWPSPFKRRRGAGRSAAGHVGRRRRRHGNSPAGRRRLRLRRVRAGQRKGRRGPGRCAGVLVVGRRAGAAAAATVRRRQRGAGGRQPGLLPRPAVDQMLDAGRGRPIQPTERARLYTRSSAGSSTRPPPCCCTPAMTWSACARGVSGVSIAAGRRADRVRGGENLMTGYILRKLLALPFVILGVSLLIFFAVRMLPGDPARLIAGSEASADGRRAHPRAARAGSSAAGPIRPVPRPRRLRRPRDLDRVPTPGHGGAGRPRALHHRARPGGLRPGALCRRSGWRPGGRGARAAGWDQVFSGLTTSPSRWRASGSA